MSAATPLFRLDGRRVLITGGASGIGAAMVRVFAAAGAAVVIADRDSAPGERLTQEVGESGGRVQFLLLDVANEDECTDAVASLTGDGAEIDVLINNAGIGHVGTMLTTTGEDLDRLYAVNVRGVFNMCRAFLPAMVARKRGVIINTASIGGVIGIRDRLAYCTTKFAVVGLTKAMALDHAMDGVRVNCICPGRVETPFVQARLKEYPDPEAAYRELASTQALGRMGRPEEIAAAALYLASDEAAFITGTDFIIDGGMSAGK